eukprot:22875-Chlamydomonas_euryale.AAC.3
MAAIRHAHSLGPRTVAKRETGKAPPTCDANAASTARASAGGAPHSHAANQRAAAACASHPGGSPGAGRKWKSRASSAGSS